MGMSAMLQSCIGKHQIMAKRTFFMHYLLLYKVFQGHNYGSKLNFNDSKVGVAHGDRSQRDEHRYFYILKLT